jgi:hypothetical protein
LPGAKCPDNITEQEYLEGSIMNGKTFLATTGAYEGEASLARAELDGDGNWAVEFLLEGYDLRCLAADPHNEDIVYAGTQGDGLLRSTDRGQTWEPAGLPGQIVKSLAISTHDPDTMYAGVKPASIFKSQDRGETWQELEGFLRIPGRRFWFSPAEKPYYQAYVQAITISPSEPDILLAGMEFGAVVRSADGGVSWSGHLHESLRDCHDLTFNASDGNWVYEAGGTGGGASVSRDAGRSWQKQKQGLAKNYGVACAADPIRPEVWYVSVAPNPGKAYGVNPEAYLYRNMGDEGWQPIGWESHPMQQMPIALVTDPANGGHLYAGLTNGDVWFSADYGDTWGQLPFNLKGIFRSLLIL